MEIDFGRVVDALPAMVWTALPDGRIDFANRRWSDYAGFSPDPARGWDWQTAVNPEDLPTLLERWRSILASGEPGELEARFRRFDGQFRWFRVDCSPMRDDADRVVKWCGVGTDIEEFLRLEETPQSREFDFRLPIDIDQMRVEEPPRDSERSSRLAVDGIPGLVAAFTPRGEVEFVNLQVIEYFGRTFEELKRWDTSDMTHPDDLPRAVELFTQSIASGEPFDFEVRARRFDGVYRWLQSRGFPLRDANGRIVRWYNLLIDIDERKRAEQALAARERNLNEIINTIPVLVWSALPDGTPEFFNQHYLDYVGLAAGQSEYWDLTAGVHPDDLSEWDATWRAILASGQAGEAEARLRRFDQKYRWFLFRANPLRDESGNIIKWYGVSIDIDERKRAEEALRQSEARLADAERDLRLTIDTIPVFVATYAPDGTRNFVNQTWRDYMGLTLEEATGECATAFPHFHPDDAERNDKAWRASLETGEPLTIEVRVRRADGQYRWYTSRRVPLRDENGNIVRWYSVGIDMDDQKRAEEALLASEREARLIVDSIPGGIEVLSPAGKIEAVNEHVARYFGKPAEELQRTGLTGLIHPQDLQKVLDTALHSTTTGDPYDAEMRFLGAERMYRWFHVRGLPLRDANGHIVRWYALHIDIDDRKRAEEALRESERNFRLTIDTIPALAWTARPDGSAEFLSQHYLDYVGLSAEKAQGWGWTVAVHPDDLSELTATWQTIMTSGKQGEAEARLRRFDGEYRWLLFRASPLRDEYGNVTKWYGVNTDIDDRKRAETNLAQEKHLLEMIASDSPLRDVLSALCKMVEEAGPGCYCDVHPIDLSGPTIEYSVAPSLPPSYTDPIAGLSLNGDALPCAIAARQKIQVVAEDIDTDPRWRESFARTHVLDHGLRSVWSTPIYARDGRVLGTLCLYQGQPASPSPQHQSLIAHATHLASIAIERSRTEAALRRSETLLAEGQQLSSTGSFSWSVDTDEVAFSEELCRIFEFAPNTPITLERVRARVHPEDLPFLSAQMARVRAGQGYLGYDIRLRMPDDRVKHLRTFGRVVSHQDGRLECLAAVQDVTERRFADEALSKARSDLAHVTRVSSLGALTASIAHEVNQPLSGIITNASTCLRMLAANPPDIEIAKETARRTIRDGNRAANVITRLRTLFSKREVSIEPIDLNEATREVIALSWGDLQRSRAIVRTELADGLPLVAGDRIQIQQVIMNLLRNAVDAMYEIDDRPRRLVIRTDLDKENQVRLSVEDAGVGFGPDGADRLFEAFYTTKSGGMGIGLSVSRSIIESHNGRLWAEPNNGPGATFSFSIPAYPGEENLFQNAGALHAPVASNAKNSAGVS